MFEQAIRDNPNFAEAHNKSHQIWQKSRLVAFNLASDNDGSLWAPCYSPPKDCTLYTASSEPEPIHVRRFS